MLPPDVFADSRNRVPAVRREELDELGRQLFDEAAADARSIAGLTGPGGIRIRASRYALLSRPVNRYLRYDAGLDPRLVELAILAAAREIDQHFEWHAHEKIAQRAGLEPAIVETVRRRAPLDGIGEKEAAIVSLAREAIGEHAVRPATFAAARRLFGVEQLILYVALMGEYVATGMLLHVFDQQLPEGAESSLP